MFHGFSLRLHKHFEHCNQADGGLKTGNNSGPQLGEMNTDQGVSTSHLIFHLEVPTTDYINALAGAPYDKTLAQTLGAQTQPWWTLHISRNSTGEDEANLLKVALAPIHPFSDASSDRGKWTDFIIEMCMNPYTTARSNNGWNFRANTGLIRVWKSTGTADANNNRSMNKDLTYIDKSRGGLLFEYQGPTGNIPPQADPTDMPACNIGGKHYCYMMKGIQPGGISNSHAQYLGMAAMRQTYAEDRQHSASNGSVNSNMVTQFQGGVAGTWEDVQPRN
jgi:hypothetical protein